MKKLKLDKSVCVSAQREGVRVKREDDKSDRNFATNVFQTSKVSAIDRTRGVTPEKKNF